MGLFNRRNKIIIQGNTEGFKGNVSIESFLTGLRLNTTIPGTINAYKTYESQVAETYRKYNSLSDYGCQQTRAIIDLRTAFIFGEGISIVCQDTKLSDWIESFLRINKLNTFKGINAIKGGELSGQILFILKAVFDKNKKLYVKVFKVPYSTNNQYRVNYDKYNDKIINIEEKDNNGNWVVSNYKHFIYVRIGGDDINSYGPTTKVGLVLTDLENYDRALKDMRRNNHIFARITPTFETDSEADAKTLLKKLTEFKWRIGEAFIGKAKFEYKTPGISAHENLKTELVATIKTISSTTGIPVHWLGFVDLMSNRSTEQTLYEFIKQSTAIERKIWEDSFTELIYKAQELYIDSGGEDLNNLNYDFEVKLPLISFDGFLDMVKALNIAYSDEVISKDDYMNMLPAINPIKTKRALELEQQLEKEKLINMGINKNNIKTQED